MRPRIPLRQLACRPPALLISVCDEPASSVTPASPHKRPGEAELSSRRRVLSTRAGLWASARESTEDAALIVLTRDLTAVHSGTSRSPKSAALPPAVSAS